MSHDLTTQAEQSLSKLAGRFEHWRRTRTNTHERIPESLWAEAVSLTQTLPIGRVARRCRLSPTDLKKRCQASNVPTTIHSHSPEPAFVELPSPGVWATPGDEPVLVELERADGARMRLRYRHTPPPLASLVQAFLEGH